ncbi:DUF294 nucleotidyltransferase-like domain-containing protein [Crenobacter cavernae]|uniref:DUF294 nucleotidyltransferase-like domain-containing protein n=1 Tax=Crenobacter cavernae TaxID=2290923 RepID=UPI001C6A85D9|nr:DUF294 nucleotidyltransferase-like domain-containing protein [Crenobacter cavernae]
MSHGFALSGSPFDVLPGAERERLEAAADLAYFADDAEILGPDSPVDTLYVLIKGKVREMAGDEVIAVYQAGDAFDARALVSGATRHRFVCHEEALAHALPRETVLALTESNPHFGAFFFASVSEKLERLAERAGRREMQTLLTATVRELGVRQPVFLDAADTLVDAARTMKTRQVHSVLVRHGDTVGIFTSSDFRDIVLDAVPGDTPLLALTRFDLISVDIDGYLFDALLTMTRHDIRRVVVLDGGKPAGVLEQVDLLSYFSTHSHLIAERIDRAGSLDALSDVAGQITRLIAQLHGHGVKAPQLARLVQALNARLFARTWQLVAPPEVRSGSCLIVMGSEGRGEQILKTDQDNALIHTDSVDPAVAARAADAFSAALARFGYPPCPGRVMVNNPDWRGTPAQWRDRLYRWVAQPTGDALMQLAIFLDAEAVAGDAASLAELKRYLADRLQDDDAFRSRFAHALDRFDTPGLIAQLLQDNTPLDLKKSGIFAVVHGCRALALEYGVAETNTFERLERLAEHGVLGRELARDAAEALAFLMTLRLKTGLAAIDAGAAPGNQVVPARLNTLERDLLKDALAVVRRFKTQLRHHYQLGAL